MEETLPGRAGGCLLLGPRVGKCQRAHKVRGMLAERMQTQWVEPCPAPKLSPKLI